MNSSSHNRARLLKKKLMGFLVAAVITVGANRAPAGSAPQTGVQGSFHDMAYLGTTYGNYARDDFQRTCIYCHTPHNAQPVGDQTGVPVPLWNRLDSTVNLTPYTWAAPANLSIDFDEDPLVGPSRMCMSCHDGVTAVDSHGPIAGTGTAQGNNNGTAVMSSPGRYIDNLSVTHPIGFQYDAALAARGTGELIDLNTGATFIDRVPNTGLADTTPAKRLASGFTYTSKRISDTLYSGYVTCASCHDAHNTNNSLNDPSISRPDYTPNYFVWAREQGSALCLSCHVK